MKKGLILINAYSQLPQADSQSIRLREELLKLGIATDIRRNDFFAAYIDSDAIISQVSEYDFCVYLDKDKYISRLLENGGMRLFNSHNAVRVCDDKLKTFIALSGKGIVMPKTLPGLLCYNDCMEVNAHALDIVENQLKYPMVVKECYSSLGKGVFEITNRQQLRDITKKLMQKPHLYQEMIMSSYGTDIRVIVIGGKVVAAMKRVSKNDFRSNIELGAIGQKIELAPEYIRKSQQVACELGLDYCGIDWLIGEGGEPILCEVNSNAFFTAIERVTDVNVAEKYAQHIAMSI